MKAVVSEGTQSIAAVAVSEGNKSIRSAKAVKAVVSEGTQLIAAVAVSVGNKSIRLAKAVKAVVSEAAWNNADTLSTSDTNDELAVDPDVDVYDCVCNRPHNNCANDQLFCVACEFCPLWWNMHPSCIGFIEEHAKDVTWKCSLCTLKEKKYNIEDNNDNVPSKDKFKDPNVVSEHPFVISINLKGIILPKDSSDLLQPMKRKRTGKQSDFQELQDTDLDGSKKKPTKRIRCCYEESDDKDAEEQEWSDPG